MSIGANGSNVIWGLNAPLSLNSGSGNQPLLLNPDPENGEIRIGHAENPTRLFGQLIIGDDNAPIRVIRYLPEDIQGTGPTIIPTGISASDYLCAMSGWQARYDHNSGFGFEQYHTYIRDDQWYVVLDPHRDSEMTNQIVDIVCFHRSLASLEGPGWIR